MQRFKRPQQTFNYMNWKEFLRPDKVKVTLFIVMLLIIFLFPIAPIMEPAPCLIPPCAEFFSLVSVYDINFWAFAGFLSYIVVLVEVVLVYILVCFVSSKLKK